MQDAKNNNWDYGMEKKLRLERRDNRTLLGTLYPDMYCVMGALQLIKTNTGSQHREEKPKNQHREGLQRGVQQLHK